MACRLKLNVFALIFPLLAGLVVSAHAQVLPDPTRPPGSAEYGGSGGQGNGGLQSIIRPADEKPRALINGTVVPLGGKVGESRLVAINTDSVVLLDSDGNREILTLTPGVSKSPAKSKSSVTR